MESGKTKGGGGGGATIRGDALLTESLVYTIV
jgi:hypothetical protein